VTRRPSFGTTALGRGPAAGKKQRSHVRQLEQKEGAENMYPTKVRRSVFVSVSLLAVLFAAALAAGPAQSPRWKAQFGARQALAPGGGLTFGQPGKARAPQGYTLGAAHTQRTPLQFSPGSLQFIRTGAFCKVRMRGADASITTAGHPALPAKSFTFALPRDTIVTGVEIVDAHYVQLADPVYAMPAPRPKRLAERHGRDERNENAHALADPDAEVYSRTTYYPGDLLRYATGRSMKERRVSVQVYPLQVKPKSGLAVFLTEGELVVSYADVAPALQGPRLGDPMPANQSECIIIYGDWRPESEAAAPDLQPVADALKDFHENTLVVKTFVIGTTEINETYISDESLHYATSPAPTPPGYGFEDATEGTRPGFAKIEDTYGPLDNGKALDGTRFMLAKRIISFIRDCEADDDGGLHYFPNLKAVVLVGDADLVPPSYYRYYSGRSDAYDEWVPTDFFYFSPDWWQDGSYDHFGDLAWGIGRIPVREISGVSAVDVGLRYVDKLTSWHAAMADADAWDNWFRNVSLWAGRIQPTWMYGGEQFVVDMVNRDYFKSMHISKRFWSNGQLDRNQTDYIIQDIDGNAGSGERGMVYYMGHADVTTLALQLEGACGGIPGGDVELTSADVLGVTTTGFRLPLMFSVGCRSASWDTNLFYGGDTDASPDQGELSVGEAFVLSGYDDQQGAGGGSCVYYGMARTAYYMADMPTFNNGVMDEVEDQAYTNELMMDYIGSYKSGSIARPGTIFYDGLFDYYMAWGGNVEFYLDGEHNRTYLQTILLGDPVVRLPERPSSIADATTRPEPEVDAGDLRADARDRYNSIDLPIVEIPYGQTGRTITVNIDAPTAEDGEVSIWLVDPAGDEMLAEETGHDASQAWETPELDDASCYWIRVAQKDPQGSYDKEAWLYVHLVNEWVAPPDRNPAENDVKILLVDGDQRDPYRLFEMIDPLTGDSNGNEPQVQSWYTDALDWLEANDTTATPTAGYEAQEHPTGYYLYDYWDVGHTDANGKQYGEITHEALEYYVGAGFRSGDVGNQMDSLVLWFNGYPSWYPVSYGENRLTAKDMDRLIDFLGSDGRLLITDQELGYDLYYGWGFYNHVYYNDFYLTYLQSDYYGWYSAPLPAPQGITWDPNTKQGGNPITFDVDHLDIYDVDAETHVSGGDGADTPWYGDAAMFQSDGERFLSWPSSYYAGVCASDGNYAAVYLTFPFEGIELAGDLDPEADGGEPNSRYNLMRRMVEWLRRPSHTYSDHQGPELHAVRTEDLEKITVSWTNPSSYDYTDLQGTILVVRTDRYPLNRDDGRVLCKHRTEDGYPGFSGQDSFQHSVATDPYFDTADHYYYAIFGFDTQDRFKTDSPSNALSQAFVDPPEGWTGGDDDAGDDDAGDDDAGDDAAGDDDAGDDDAGDDAAGDDDAGDDDAGDDAPNYGDDDDDDAGTTGDGGGTTGGGGTTRTGGSTGGGGGGGGGICAIATASYESRPVSEGDVLVSDALGAHYLTAERARRLDTIRRFRDTVLLRTGLGRHFVSWYYALSPTAADAISRSESVKAAVRRTVVEPLFNCSSATLDD